MGGACGTRGLEKYIKDWLGEAFRKEAAWMSLAKCVYNIKTYREEIILEGQIGLIWLMRDNTIKCGDFLTQ
jgi:hypothetical protein